MPDTPLHLAIFGGTGRTGVHLVDGALAAGHRVRVLARDPGRLTTTHPALAVVAGDVLDPDAVARTVAGADAVLSALGGAGTAAPGDAVAGGMRHIVAAMEQHGVRRVVALAGAGILDLPGVGLRNERPGYPAAFRLTTQQHRQAWDALAASALDWTLVCTPDLLPGPPTRRFRVLDDQLPEGGRTIPRADVAAFMLDELTRRAHVRRRVGLTD